MEVRFEKRTVSYLEPVLWDVQNMEQTQELRIPEGMPGIGRIICTWGQPVLRSREWQGGRISAGAGMMVWVLYVPEDGGKLQCVESWIPFQFHWDLPDSGQEGAFLVTCLPGFADSRLVSAGKMLIRCGIRALAEAYVPREREISIPGEVPEGLEFLTNLYPVRLPKEAGEKVFEMEEQLTLPQSAPVPERLIRWQLDAIPGERKLLGGRLVFRGTGLLRVLYESKDGQIHSWDFELPFSQFAELKQGYSADGGAEIRMMPTNLELSLEDGGSLRFRASLTAQYLVEDREELLLAEDAWCPTRKTEIHREMLELPALLDSRQERISGDMDLPAEADLIVDIRLMPDFPGWTGKEAGGQLTMGGTLQVLYYDTAGQLRSISHRWESSQSLDADESVRVRAVPMMPVQIYGQPGPQSIEVRGTVPVWVGFSGGEGLPMMTGVEAGEPVQPDAGRPSLVLCRAGQERLWDIARRNGSTVGAIRTANHLEGEPEPGRMLLIPVQ